LEFRYLNHHHVVPKVEVTHNVNIALLAHGASDRLKEAGLLEDDLHVLLVNNGTRDHFVIRTILIPKEK